MSDLDKIVASIRRQLRDEHDDRVILYPAQWQAILALLSQDRGEGVECCRVCNAPIANAELCEICAVGNDPFQQSKYGEGRS